MATDRTPDEELRDRVLQDQNPALKSAVTTAQTEYAVNQAQTAFNPPEQTVAEPEKPKTSSVLHVKGSGAEFRIIPNKGKVFFQFKSRKTRQWRTVLAIREDGSLGISSRATQNYVPRGGEAPRQ